MSREDCWSSSVAEDRLARCSGMSLSIAFVGAGPTTIYTLCAFLKAAGAGAEITIFEEQGRAGLGMPYRPGWNDPAMLSNIASVEIPPIEETLIDWLGRQPRARLVRLGIDPDDIDDHAFYPRLALGEYFLEKFTALITHAGERGVAVGVVTRACVTDIVAEGERLRLHVTLAHGSPFAQTFDRVVLATGHQWPEEPEVKPGYFLSPWPATALKRIPPTAVAIRGSSLTAIDAAVALATSHGSFIERDDGAVTYDITPGSEAFELAMLSRKGLLPEADFFHPVPYEPLAICTPEAIERLISAGGDDLLEQAYSLFRRELGAADPDYARRVGLDTLALEDLAERYFAERSAVDPFEWAEHNLVEARANFEASVTVAWRYAILRMHEVLALIAPHLDAEALDRFNRFLKPVFVDEYATVPHLSIERLLALRRAGRLEVVALGDDARIDTTGSGPGVTLRAHGERRRLPVLIEATGQRPLGVEAFPFASLLAQGVVRDARADDAEGPKGVAVDDLFHPVSDHPAAPHVYCLSIPFILGRHPFVQGITSSNEMGGIVGADLAASVNRSCGSALTSVSPAAALAE